MWKGIEFGALDARNGFISTFGNGYTTVSRELIDDFVMNTYLAKHRDWLTKEAAASTMMFMENEIE